MKNTFLLTSLYLTLSFVSAQKPASDIQNKQAIYTLIDQYSLAREKKDTVLLKSILTPDVDQLVSSGVWRIGIRDAVQGMLRSSESNSGSRKIIVDKIRFLNAESAVADARYEIQNPDGTIRKMWSTFIVVYSGDRWKISGIRNMLPQP
jgi:hypothetical protein